jgi:hypothetical protein
MSSDHNTAAIRKVRAGAKRRHSEACARDAYVAALGNVTAYWPNATDAQALSAARADAVDVLNSGICSCGAY